MKNVPLINAQNGSAIYIILIAVAIFGALSYAIFQGGRSAQSNLTAEQARLAAQEIIQYGDSLAKTVQKLRLAGCEQDEISFDTASSATYNNAASPSDESCHVLSLSGGKLNINTPAVNFFDPTLSASAYFGEWYFTGRSCIPGIGTGGNACSAATESDLIAVLPWIKEDICKAINKILTSSDTIPTEADNAYSSASPFTGTFPAPYNINSSTNEMNGQASLCFKGAAANPVGGYHFYSVLIAR